MYPFFSMTLGSHIRKLRKDLKMTIQDLSIKTNLSLPYISDVERDQVNPSYLSLCKFADGLGISLPELVNYDEDYEAHNQLEINRLREIIKIIKDCVNLEVPNE